MFEEPRYISNHLSIAFPRVQDMRRKANRFEDRLQGKYQIPQIVPIADDVDPEIPRIIFNSNHGNSQIVISQINISFNVTYTPDWQLDPQLGRDYISKRLQTIFGLFDFLPTANPHFCGFVTLVRLSTKRGTDYALDRLRAIYLNDQRPNNEHDILVRLSRVQDEQFFENMTIANFRTWQNVENVNISPMSDKAVIDVGLEISCDYNDRYSYNENSEYRTDRKTADKLVTAGFTKADEEIRRIRS